MTSVVLITTCLGWADAGSPVILDTPAGARPVTEAAATDELVTDRPDVTESSEVVRAGWLQIESGLATERFHATGASAVTVGAPLLRFGLGHKLELRIASEGSLAERDAAGEALRLGRADAEVGFKYKFFGQGRYRPAVGFIGATSIPTGSSRFSSGTWEPGIKLTWAKDVPLGFSLSGNFNWNALASENGRYHYRGITLSVGHDLPFGFGGYWEVYGLSGPEPGDSRQIMLATGITRSVGRHAQWDVSFSQRVTKMGPDQIYACGFSLRRPLGLILSHR